LGPIAVYFGLNALIGQPAWANGWGIPTATDIALAWLVAKLIFGKGHPAISFLLLLAVADDAIGLGIIAFAYPDPAHPTAWLNALWIVPGMLTAYALRRCKVNNWLPYVAIGGTLCWWGLHSAHLHPALALVFVVPFIPGPNKDLGLYLEYQSEAGEKVQHSPLENFEHALRSYVDYGLFFFAFANAGVSLEGISGLTWIVLASLLVGKTLGITLCSYVAELAGFRLPIGMSFRHLIVTSVIAGLGLTVALFVSGQAFTAPGVQGAAKMGALLSVLAGGVAFILATVLGVSNIQVGALLNQVLGRPVRDLSATARTALGQQEFSKK
jgi:NhaA family Na+:H+ antiporter